MILLRTDDFLSLTARLINRCYEVRTFVKKRNIYTIISRRFLLINMFRQTKQNYSASQRKGSTDRKEENPSEALRDENTPFKDQCSDDEELCRLRADVIRPRKNVEYIISFYIRRYKDEHGGQYPPYVSRVKLALRNYLSQTNTYSAYAGSDEEFYQNVLKPITFQ